MAGFISLLKGQTLADEIYWLHGGKKTPVTTELITSALQSIHEYSKKVLGRAAQSVQITSAPLDKVPKDLTLTCTGAEWSLPHAGEEFTAMVVDRDSTPTMSLADWHEVLFHCAAFLDLEKMIEEVYANYSKKAMARTYANQLRDGAEAARERMVNKTDLRSRF